MHCYYGRSQVRQRRVSQERQRQLTGIGRRLADDVLDFLPVARRPTTMQGPARA